MYLPKLQAAFVQSCVLVWNNAKNYSEKKYFCNFDVSVKSAEEDVPRLLARPHMPLVGAVSDHNLFCHHHQPSQTYFVIIIISDHNLFCHHNLIPILSPSTVSGLFCHHQATTISDHTFFVIIINHRFIIMSWPAMIIITMIINIITMWKIFVTFVTYL